MNQEKNKLTETQMIEASFVDLVKYSVSPMPAKVAYKHYQLAQLRLLAICSLEKANRIHYAALAFKMKRFLVLRSIFARPETLELFIPGRHWVLALFLKKEGFRYIQGINSWYYTPVMK